MTDETEERATRMFETGGGLEFCDRVAAGLQERVDESFQTSRSFGGVMTNRVELGFLLEGYRRLRREEES